MPKITLKTISESIDKLALSVARGFESVDEKFAAVDKRLDNLEKGQEDITMRLDSKADKIDFPHICKQFKKT